MQLRRLCLSTTLLTLASASTESYAQQTPIGSVSLVDANVTGSVSTANDRAQLAGNGTVTAKDRVAYVELNRGGNIRVCATSGLHLTAGAPNASSNVVDPNVVTPAPPAPLMLSLDRGALEIRMNATTNDILMTPDLRVAISNPGPLDLRLRVTRNGDTCVENRVTGISDHPTLRVGSLFGPETYDVLPGQHVLFERASLHEVVDNESSPCGCPEQPAIPIVEAGQISLKPGEKVSSKQAEVQHPFPAAVSQGLVPPPPVPQAPPGQTHTQIAATLSYSEADPTALDTPANKAAATPTPAPAATPPQPQKKGGLFHSIGRFFKRVF